MSTSFACEFDDCKCVKEVKGYYSISSDFADDDDGEWTDEEIEDWKDEPVFLCDEHAKGRTLFKVYPESNTFPYMPEANKVRYEPDPISDCELCRKGECSYQNHFIPDLGVGREKYEQHVHEHHMKYVDGYKKLIPEIRGKSTDGIILDDHSFIPTVQGSYSIIDGPNKGGPIYK